MRLLPYVAISSVGLSTIMGLMIGLNGSTRGSLYIRVHPKGDVSLITGSQLHGQGHVTT